MTRTFTFTVVDSDAVPPWVGNVPVNSGWTPIAGGTAWPGLAPWQQGARVVDVAAQPAPSKLGYQAIESIIRGWNGGSVDPLRREMLLVANGGHTSYVGNEAYALQFNQPVPAWKRLCDPTPIPSEWEDFTGPPSTLTLADMPALHLDGRTRSMHTSGSPQYGNGRVWFPFQTSVTCGGGASAQGVISFDRDGLAQRGDFATWDSADPFPYQAHGIAGLTGAQSGWVFGSSAYDSDEGRVWYYGQARCYGLNTATGLIDKPSAAHGQPFGARGFNGAWAVCLPDLRKVFIGLSRTAGQPIYVHDLTKEVGAPGAFTLFTTANSAQNALTWDPDSYWYNWANPGVPNDGTQSGTSTDYAVLTNPYHYDVFNYGMGAVYSNGLVYVGPTPCRFTGTLGGDVHVLNPSTMTWTVLENPGDRPTTLAGLSIGSKTQNGNFRRFNIVEWGGVRVLIHAADTHGPTHVWRIS